MNTTYFTYGSKTLSSRTAGAYPGAVRELQRRLYAWGYHPPRFDGAWNSDTETAVRKYQVSKGLKEDGVVGSVIMSCMLNFTYASSEYDPWKERIVPPLFKQLVCKWSSFYGLNPVQVYAMVDKESTWYRERDNCIRWKDKYTCLERVYGLLMLRCDTARGERYEEDCQGAKDSASGPAGGMGLYHADTNLRHGCSYMRRWLDRSPARFPTLQNAIAAHNMGCECLAEHYVPLVLKLIRYYGNFNNG